MSSERVLVMLKGYLGDAVLATPLLRSLAEKELAVRATDTVHDLLRAPDLLYRQLPATDVKGLAKLIEESRKLRSQKFGVAILVNRSFRAALLARLAKIPIRIGHATEGRSALLTRTVSYDPLAPEAQSYADLAKPLGITVDCLAPRLYVSPAEDAAAGQLLAGVEIGFQPGARFPEKTIPLSSSQDLVRGLEAAGKEFVLLGGRDELDSARGLTGGRNLIGALALRESMAVASRLRVLIGGDTGLLHVAAAVGCATVTAFGPGTVEKWGRLNPPHQIVRGVDGDISTVTGEMLIAAVSRV